MLRLLVADLLTAVCIPDVGIRGVADPVLLCRLSKYGRKQGGKEHKWEHDLIVPEP